MKKRLISFLKHLGIGQLAFEENVGLSRGYVNKIGDNITLKSLDKIEAAYPELNINWLKTGDGEMLKTDTPKKETTTNNDSLVEYLKEKIKELEQENKRLLTENGFYRGLLEKNNIDYSHKAR